MLVTYTMMRNKGFRVMPFGASKIPAVAGIAMAGMLGHSYGSAFATRVMGNREQYYYLIGSRRSIVNGGASFDMP